MLHPAPSRGPCFSGASAALWRRHLAASVASVTQPAKARVPRDDVRVPWTFLPFGDEQPRVFSRFQDHFERTVAADMLYLMYNHEDERSPPQPKAKPFVRGLKPRNAMHKTRQAPELPDNAPPPDPRARTSAHIPRLSTIEVKATNLDSMIDKMLIIPPLVATELITSVMPKIVRAKFSDMETGLRRGYPMAAQVDLKNSCMMIFAEKLIELALPKYKNWLGIHRPGEINDIPKSPGSILLELPESVFRSFPDIELTADVFNKLPALSVKLITTGSSYFEAAVLLSALQLPYETEASRSKRLLLNRGAQDSSLMEQKKREELLAKRRIDLNMLKIKKKTGK